MCCSGLLGWMHFAMEWKERMDEAVDGTNRSGHCRTGGNGRNSEKNELIKGIGSCDYMFVEICQHLMDYSVGVSLRVWRPCRTKNNGPRGMEMLHNHWPSSLVPCPSSQFGILAHLFFPNGKAIT